ncbi:putative monooxygenase y4iD [Psilocybe cubensis]|uniref:Monooxygenase y4iD n=1 Tax=Psilocybe cubensis TaxID=181762 RepID=A0ACB8GI46_PSICU|nr:putative monooxygenase y4iD [Psilocybe cubensis]KAH9475341.1 putative monooxygenase y4iD [Psilocybe cubensis]
MRIFKYLWRISYILTQLVIVYLFKAPPPKRSDSISKPHGRIAVIGAGVTGISSAAHAISHGFEVVIFEAGSKDSVGGIWSHVNTTSGLQLNSLLYRFHPAIIWSKAFPLRDEILGEIRRIWKEYHLDTRTRFDTKVTCVSRAPEPKDKREWESDPDRTRWLINDGKEGVFDAVIVTIGTCGEPNWITLPGMPDKIANETNKSKEKEDTNDPWHPSQDSPSPDLHNDNEFPPLPEPGEDVQKEHGDKFMKTIIHSSELDSPTFKLKGGERVVVIGSGASGVEAVETVIDKFGSVVDHQGQSSKGEKDQSQTKGVEVTMIARDDKWIIPRNIIIDTCIAGQPFGREMPLSFLWETFLRYFQYHGIEELIPKTTGIYEGTPVVNDVFLSHVRTGRCHYVRGSPIRLTSKGVVTEARKKSRRLENKANMKPSSFVEEIQQGEEKLVEADVIILATGYKKPSIDFLPQDLFPDGYQRPDLYLQNFSTEDWSILMTNSAYMNAIGTV